jgi:Fe2+ or Zn2+ uptake regulation protein
MKSIEICREVITEETAAPTAVRRIGSASDLELKAQKMPAAQVADYAKDKGNEKGVREMLFGSHEEMTASLIHQLGKVTGEPGPEPEDPRFRSFCPSDYAELVIPDSDTLLNDHFLDRKTFGLYVGSSGMGKSSSIAQLIIAWGIGRETLGLKPLRPLKVLMLQAEDIEYDMKAMFSGVLKGMGISRETSPKEFELQRNNVRIERVDWSVGGHFLLEVVLPLLDSFRPDILVLNPFNAYLGAGNRDDEKVTWFLRTMLNPMLSAFNCAAIIVHHTPKTNFQNRDDWSHFDFMYAGAGAADMVNAARAVIVVEPTKDPDVFCFIGAKRGRQLAWTDGGGKTVFRQYFAYACKHDSHAGMFWVPATKEDIKGAAKGNAKPTPFDRVIAVVDYIARSKAGNLRKPEKLVAKISEKFGCSRRTAQNTLSDAVEHGYLESEGKTTNAIYEVTPEGHNKLQDCVATTKLDDDEIEQIQQVIEQDNPVRRINC